ADSVPYMEHTSCRAERQNQDLVSWSGRRGASPTTPAVARLGLRTACFADLKAQDAGATVARPLERIARLFRGLAEPTLHRTAGKRAELDLGGVTWLQLAQRISVLGQVHLSALWKHFGCFIGSQLANLDRHRCSSRLQAR